MASKKKNSNYVTDKTSKKKAEAAQKKQAEKTKKTVMAILVPSVVVLLVAAVLLGVMIFGGAFDYMPEPTNHVSVTLDGYTETLHIELYGDDADKTVKHFLSLVNSKYYDGQTIEAYIDGNLYFSRVNSTTGIQGEFESNGVENKIPFKPGTLVMARGEGKDSAYGRFFIVTENTDVSALKGNYAAFGRITGGMDVIEQIIDKINPAADGSIPVGEQVFISEISTHDAH